MFLQLSVNLFRGRGGGGARVPPVQVLSISVAVADPGIPEEAINPKGGANLLFGFFSRKLHENEEIFAGGAFLVAPRSPNKL